MVANTWFRLSKLGAVGRHLKELFEMLEKEFERHIPPGDLVVGRADVSPVLGRISLGAKVLLRLRLIACLGPWHNPARQRVPPWFSEWMKAEREGVDMSQYYGVKKSPVEQCKRPAVRK